jgi:hypothetical protein
MNLFSEYILPNFDDFRADDEVRCHVNGSGFHARCFYLFLKILIFFNMPLQELVRVTYAANISAIAECAFRYLNLAQVSITVHC